MAGRCIVGTFPMGYECINDECCSITEVSVGNEHIVLFCCMCLLSFRSFKDAPIGQNHPGLARETNVQLDLLAQMAYAAQVNNVNIFICPLSKKLNLECPVNRALKGLCQENTCPAGFDCINGLCCSTAARESTLYYIFQIL